MSDIVQRPAYDIYCKAFHQQLLTLAKDAKALYRVAGKVCTMSKRPPSLDHEDHLHDAVMVALETIREATPTFRYPYDLEPEYWLVRCVRRTFHSKSFYYKEFVWASKRLHGHLTTGDAHECGSVSTTSAPIPVPAFPDDARLAGSHIRCMDSHDLFVDDVCGLVPDNIKPLIRLLGQGATPRQAERILGKKRDWVWWRLIEVRKRMIAAGMEPSGTIFTPEEADTDE